MIAVNTIRMEPHYRRAAFDDGLRRLGYQLPRAAMPKDRRDLLVLWNRQGQYEADANDWEARGGTVIVCENGYIGKDELDRQLYAIAVHGHNGSGWFPVGPEDRFSALGIELKPWVEAGDILVCAQRGIGSRLMASPPRWEATANTMLRKLGKTAIRIRQHPGRHAPEIPLATDLARAGACVIWSSASGVKALTMGVPVVYDAPHWICSPAAAKGFYGIDKLVRDDALRLKAMHRMSHAQWRVAEIESGEPFARILARLEEAKW